MTVPAALVLALVSLQRAAVDAGSAGPASPPAIQLDRGWEVTGSAAPDAAAALLLPPEAWSSADPPAASPPTWARLAILLPPSLSGRSLALELAAANGGDEVFAGAVPALRLPHQLPALFELHPSAGGGPLVLLLRLSPRPPGTALFAEPPRLEPLASALERDFRRRLPQLVTSVAIASFGLLSLLLFLRDRSRRALALYAAFAAGIACYTSAALVSWLCEGLRPALLHGAVSSLAFLLPATGYLFLVRFLDLPLVPWRAALLAFPAIGLTLVLAGSSPASVSGWSGLTLFALGGELLVALARPAGRPRGDSALLFLGTAALLLSALFDAAAERSIVFSPTRLPLLGPAFLIFTALLLVAVADEGRRLLLRATTDPLTGVANRQEFMRRAEEELRRAERTGGTVAMVMLDLDHFKSINDRFGHPAGDRALVAAARAVAETIRGLDVVGRYGGEEFVVLLVNPAESSVLLAVERVRAAIAALVPPQVPEPVTVSAGVAVLNGLFERATVPELIKRADAALYVSKRSGRDRATLEPAAASAPRSAAEVRYR